MPKQVSIKVWELHCSYLIVPLFNKEEHIVSTLESVRLQSLQISEIILVDNGCTDQTVRRAQEYLNEFAISYTLLVELKKGAGYARNAGIKFVLEKRSISNHGLIFFLDADDLWLSSHVELMARQSFACDSGILSSCYVLDRDFKSRNLFITHKAIQKSFGFEYFWNRGFICSSSVAIRVSAAVKGFRFSTSAVGEDILTWFDQVPNYSLSVCDCVSVIIRRNEDQGSSRIIGHDPEAACLSETWSELWPELCRLRRNFLIGAQFKRFSLLLKLLLDHRLNFLMMCMFEFARRLALGLCNYGFNFRNRASRLPRQVDSS